MSATPEDPREFTDIGALRVALRAEHAAVYGYAYIGAHCAGGRRERSYEHLDAHRAQRDTLSTLLAEREAEPDPSESAYGLPDSTDDADLDTYAARLEEQTAQGYLELAAASDSVLRDLAARSLQSATVRALEWGGKLTPFPGFSPDQAPKTDAAE
ncbi:ferritin-like domain-containing protein [Nocardiopsis rhodophaea]|uniref:Ferritin-like domain-containing protein n=1 Tax=Nocardiopsis rhodophaea TaxID=280238 RepID=A0ABP5EV71_9ACTN